MRHLLSAPIAALSFIGLVQAASAADLPRKAPVAVPVAYNWTGFYIGANVGGGWGRRNIDYTANDGATALLFTAAGGGGQPAPTSFNTSGALGGLQLGYNWQLGANWLIGGEADFDWSGLKGSNTTNPVIGAATYAASAEEKIKWFGTVRARLGYLPAPNILAYVTGGFAYGRVERNGSYNNISGTTQGFAGGPGLTCFANATCLSGSSSSVAAGWTLGGGLEYAFLPKWTLKAEYLYVSLAGKSLTETAIAAPALSSLNVNYSRTNFNVARLGVNYRF